jgi:hypothetical protein
VFEWEEEEEHAGRELSILYCLRWLLRSRFINFENCISALKYREGNGNTPVKKKSMKVKMKMEEKHEKDKYERENGEKA